MIRRTIGHLMAAGAFVFVACLSGAGTISAFAETTPSDLTTDVQAGQTGETDTANDADQAEEVDVDNGEVEQVGETQNGTHGDDGSTEGNATS